MCDALWTREIVPHRANKSVAFALSPAEAEANSFFNTVNLERLLRWHRGCQASIEEVTVLNRLLGIIVAMTMVTSPAFGQSPQETHTGRAEPGFITRYAFTPPASGQLLATLSWDTNSAALLMILVCTVEGEDIGYGVAAGLMDRFARLEAGILGTYPCEIGVMTAMGSASYMLNLQRSQPEPSNAQEREPVPASRRTALRTVIPGSPRGGTMERIAFRLQRAANF
jgi:hypothetical protein